MATLALLVVVTVGVPAYVKTKYENLATKQDTEVLTRIVEDVRADFRVREERFKTLLARDITAHRLRFAAEFKTYRMLWRRLLRLRKMLDQVMINSVVSPGRRTVAGSADAYEQFRRAVEDLDSRILECRPFTTIAVHRELFVALLEFRLIAAQGPPSGTHGDEDATRAYIRETTGKISERVSAVGEAIQKRLYADTEAAGLPLESWRVDRPVAEPGDG